jgi:isovaleryl-CoA dehydrogenase
MATTNTTIFGGSFLVAPIGTQAQFTPEELGEDAQAIGQAARDFVEGEVLPRDADIDKLDLALSRSLLRKAGELGLLSLEIPEAYDGMDLDKLSGLLVLEELGRQASFSVSYGAHTGIGTLPIVYFGSPEQKATYLPRLGSGELVAAYALTEPSAGSDAMNSKTVATLDGDQWVLNGSKMWITNGGDADTLVVYAKTDPQMGARGMTTFIVEKGTKGFSVAQKLDKLGMRGSHTGELVFENVEVPIENVLGEEGGGAKVLMSGLDFERAVLSGGPLGIMHACLDVVLPYVHDRQQFGRSIGEFQLMQGKLADMYTTMMACRAYVYEVGRACDRATPETVRHIRKDAAGAILFASERATWMAGEAIQALGGNGYINDYPTGRLWRDAKLYEIGAGTSEIRRMLIGRELFAETM